LPNIEDLMVAVALWIEEQGGHVETDPGQLIRTIAEGIFDIDIPSPFYRSREYHGVSRALIALEEAGMVTIDRWTVGYPRQANKLVSVTLITD
jgi:hypothetical protein